MGHFCAMALSRLRSPLDRFQSCGLCTLLFSDRMLTFDPPNYQEISSPQRALTPMVASPRERDARIAAEPQGLPIPSLQLPSSAKLPAICSELLRKIKEVRFEVIDVSLQFHSRRINPPKASSFAGHHGNLTTKRGKPHQTTS